MTDDPRVELDLLIRDLQKQAEERETLLELYREGRRLEEQGKPDEAAKTMLQALERARAQELQLFDGLPAQDLLGLVEAVNEATEWRQKAEELAQSLPRTLTHIQDTLASYRSLRRQWDQASATGPDSTLDDAQDWTRRVREVQEHLEKGGTILHRKGVQDCLLQFEALLAGGEPFRSGTERMRILLGKARDELGGIPEEQATNLSRQIKAAEEELGALSDLKPDDSGQVEDWRKALAARRPLGTEDQERLRRLADTTGSLYLARLWAQSMEFVSPQAQRSDAVPSTRIVRRWWEKWAAMAKTRSWDWQNKKAMLKALQDEVKQRANLWATGAGGDDGQVRRWEERLAQALHIGENLSLLEKRDGGHPRDPQGIRTILDWLHGLVTDVGDEVFVLFLHEWQQRFDAYAASYIEELGTSGQTSERPEQMIARLVLERYRALANNKAQRGQALLDEAILSTSPQAPGGSAERQPAQQTADGAPVRDVMTPEESVPTATGGVAPAREREGSAVRVGPAVVPLSQDGRSSDSNRKIGSGSFDEFTPR